MHRNTSGRFPPAYVSRVRLDLMATPELDAEQQQHADGS